MEMIHWTTSTRTYVTEHTSLIIDGVEYEGIYKWMNRPWQRYEYQSSSIQAIKRAFKNKALSETLYEAFLESAEDSLHVLESEVRNA